MANSRVISRLLVALALSGCAAEQPAASESRDDAGPRVCDPLSTDTEPVMLGNVIAAGRAADGALYVLSGRTSPLTPDLVFVSEAGALQRRNVLGSGTSGNSDYTVSFEDGAAQSRLVVKRQASEVVGMALVHDGGRSFFDALPSDAERLEIVAASEVASLPVKNIPGMITVEFVADAPDGSQLVLTRPTVDWSYEDFRLYYGKDGKLIERAIKNASRGSNTYVTFVVDGQDYDVVFASAFLSPSTSSTLRGKDGTQVLTLASGTPRLPEGVSFECLH